MKTHGLNAYVEVGGEKPTDQNHPWLKCTKCRICLGSFQPKTSVLMVYHK